MNVCMVHFQSQNSHAHFSAGKGGFDGGSNLLGKNNHAAQFIVGKVKQIVHLALGNYQGVTLSHGTDVEKENSSFSAHL